MIITTSDQLDAANRHDSGGVVYVLSVTLYAASGGSPPVDPTTINLYWSTREFTDFQNAEAKHPPHVAHSL